MFLVSASEYIIFKNLYNSYKRKTFIWGCGDNFLESLLKYACF